MKYLWQVLIFPEMLASGNEDMLEVLMYLAARARAGPQNTLQSGADVRDMSLFVREWINEIRDTGIATP